MYTIGRLALRAKVNVDTIRFYERQGLLSCETKTDFGYRLYSDDALRRIAFIKRAQCCGFSLAEIRELLDMHKSDAASQADAYRLAARKQAELTRTMQVMERMSQALASVLADNAKKADRSVMQHAESPLLDALETAVTARRGAASIAA
jgi:MerR family Zn(II)-responsive transcriptional regulator of zntA